MLNMYAGSFSSCGLVYHNHRQDDDDHDDCIVKPLLYPREATEHPQKPFQHHSIETLLCPFIVMNPLDSRTLDTPRVPLAYKAPML